MDAFEVTAPSVPWLVVAGASNVSRGLPRLFAAARGRSGGPVDGFVAAGHGRSYGADSRVAWRKLPSILGCGLWRALDRVPRDHPPPLALVTDIGNDLLYGFAPDAVTGWVETTVARLAERQARLVVTRLPLASLATVSPLRYRSLRAFYVPRCRLSLAELRTAVDRLEEGVAAVASRYGATLLEQPGDWYGIDAIHVRRRRLDRLWERVCTGWGLPTSAARRATIGEWIRIGARGAEVRVIAGRRRFTRQPAVRLADGSRIWLY